MDKLQQRQAATRALAAKYLEQMTLGTGTGTGGAYWGGSQEVFENGTIGVNSGILKRGKIVLLTSDLAGGLNARLSEMGYSTKFSEEQLSMLVNLANIDGVRSNGIQAGVKIPIASLTFTDTNPEAHELVSWRPIGTSSYMNLMSGGAQKFIKAVVSRDRSEEEFIQYKQLLEAFGYEPAAAALGSHGSLRATSGRVLQNPAELKFKQYMLANPNANPLTVTSADLAAYKPKNRVDYAKGGHVPGGAAIASGFLGMGAKKGGHTDLDYGDGTNPFGDRAVEVKGQDIVSAARTKAKFGSKQIAAFGIQSDHCGLFAKTLQDAYMSEPRFSKIVNRNTGYTSCGHTPYTAINRERAISRQQLGAEVAEGWTKAGRQQIGLIGQEAVAIANAVARSMYLSSGGSSNPLVTVQGYASDALIAKVLPVVAYLNKGRRLKLGREGSTGGMIIANKQPLIQQIVQPASAGNGSATVDGQTVGRSVVNDNVTQLGLFPYLGKAFQALYNDEFNA